MGVRVEPNGRCQRLITRRRVPRWLAVLLIAAILGASAGCLPAPLLSDLPAFFAGWFLRGLVVQGDASGATCYRNGVAVDCSELPQDVLQSSQ